MIIFQFYFTFYHFNKLFWVWIKKKYVLQYSSSYFRCSLCHISCSNWKTPMLLFQVYFKFSHFQLINLSLNETQIFSTILFLLFSVVYSLFPIEFSSWYYSRYTSHFIIFIVLFLLFFLSYFLFSMEKPSMLFQLYLKFANFRSNNLTLIENGIQGVS